LILALYGGFLLITHGDIGSLAVSKIALLSGLMGTLGSTLFNILPHPLQKKYGVIAVNGWSMLIAGLVFGLLNQPWKIPFIIARPIFPQAPVIIIRYFLDMLNHNLPQICINSYIPFYKKKSCRDKPPGYLRNYII